MICPKFVARIRWMKAVSREVFRMLGQLFMRYSKHIKNNHSVTIGNLLELSIEDDDALLILATLSALLAERKP